MLACALAVIAFAVGAGGCSKSVDGDAALRAEYVQRQLAAADAGARYALVSGERVQFDDGWFESESDAQGASWRWMGKRGLLRLRAEGPHAMKVTLTGWVPRELLQGPPTITVTLDGQRIDSFVAPTGTFTREFFIPMPMVRTATYVDFLVETSVAGKPKGDTRELGYALRSVTWEITPG